MARLAACLGALALVCSVSVAGTAAGAWNGGVSAPPAEEPSGGLVAPGAAENLAGVAQADEPGADEPGEGEPPPAAVEPAPGAGVPDGEPPPPGEDRGIGIVVPLPGDPALEEPPETVTTSVTALPRTGRDTHLLALIGLLLIAAGGGVRVVSRPGRAASA